MEKGKKMSTTNFDEITYGDPNSDILLIQMTGDHEQEAMEREVSLIRELSGVDAFCFKAVKVVDWNRDLSPWSAPAVFGNEDFGDGAPDTLKFLTDNILSDVGSRRMGEAPDKKIYLGGYSLAGLFSLWAGYQTDAFDGIAAASPSVWFPGFTNYMRENTFFPKKIYLSMGDREEKTRNPVMSQVGNKIRECEEILKKVTVDCILEWNQGNHFKEPELRTAKAFAYLIKSKK